MFCGHATYYGKAIVSWSDLFFFCEIDERIFICRMGHREILHIMHLFLFYYKMLFPSKRPVDILLYS